LTPKFVNSATANGAVNKKKRRWKSDSCTPLPSRRPEKHSPWFTSSCLRNYLRTVSTKVHEYPRSFGCVITSASFVTGDYPFNRTPPALRGGTCRTTVIPRFVNNATKKWVGNKNHGRASHLLLRGLCTTSTSVPTPEPGVGSTCTSILLPMPPLYATFVNKPGLFIRRT
jgi:hypothetical protein